MCGWLKTGMDIMADYSVACSKLGNCADKEQDIIKLIAEYQRSVSDIGYHVRIKGTSEQTLRENILAIVDSIEDCKARTTVLSIINYLIQLYKTASDAGIPNAFGTAIGVGGLITGVVADIMGGMNSEEL